MRRLGEIAVEIVKGALMLGGLGLATWGFHLAWEPLGYIVPGLILLSTGVISEIRS